MSNNDKWGALSMRDRAFLIREAVRNGITDINSIRDTWEHRFDGESDTINGGEIPAVTITPEKWQKEFAEFSKKNPEIRESIDENWVLPDRRRKSKEMEQQFDRDFLEGNMDYDEYKKHYSRQKNRSNRFPVYYDTSSDRIYKRILDVYKAAGEPRIYTGEGRPYYLKGVIGKHSIHNISTVDDFISELAHPIEGTGIITYLKDLPKTLRGELTRSYEHYEDPNHFEYKTHKIVEPSLRNYILKGGHTPYIHEYSGEEPNIIADGWNKVKGWFRKDAPTEVEEPKYITKNNYVTELANFRNAFEEYRPDAYWDAKGKKWTVGTGLTYYIDDQGRETKVKKGDRISREDNDIQIARRVERDENYARKKTPFWDNYHPELKFQILEAMYNAGNANVWEKSPNYRKALRRYEENKGWENKDYDLKDIFQHADWNLNDQKWLGIRSRMRRNPQAINPEDYSKIYLNHYRDSLRTVYDEKYKK